MDVHDEPRSIDDEKTLRTLLDRIEQIDGILQHPVSSLIRLAASSGSQSRRGGPISIPPWISERAAAGGGTYWLTRSVCCSTLQRVWRSRRRFDWLSHPDDKQHIPGKRLEALQARIGQTFVVTAARPRLSRYSARLGSKTFGALNPLTASNIFWVLLNAGEKMAHGGIGFLAFFAIMWSLGRRSVDEGMTGALIEPWKPTAFVTAKCLLPIRILCEICRQRATLLDAISDTVEEIQREAGSETIRGRWRVTMALEQLINQLSDLSEIAVDRRAFKRCAKQISVILQNVDRRKLARVASEVDSNLRNNLKVAARSGLPVLNSVEPVIRMLRKELLPLLSARGVAQLQRLDIRVPENPNAAYWSERKMAAEIAIQLCERAFNSLKGALEAWKQIPRKRGAVPRALRDVANINRIVAEDIWTASLPAARWCFDVIGREISHGSAGNLTDFDPPELVSGIAVAARWGLMSGNLELRDAAKKALQGSRPDGSWVAGQPFYVGNNRMLGAWPITSDVIWMLASAVGEEPGVRVADAAFIEFVNWLERTRTTFKNEQYGLVSGWASELARQDKRIDVWATAHAINALLQIREIAEFRLWQMAARRFTVVKDLTDARNIDPVDLGRPHTERLHHLLWRMGRESADSNYTTATYSLVLHGPPGSSKTVMAEALAREMWRTSAARRAGGAPRLIRITPADFTRLGEAHLDASARFIFDLISHLRNTTVLFDEIDDLLGRRKPGDRLHFMKLVIPAMLNRLADLRKACPRQEVCFILATNYIDTIEPALYREGRIDTCVAVVYPDARSRELVAQNHFTVGAIVAPVVRETAGLSWMRVQSYCKDLKRSPGRKTELRAGLGEVRGAAIAMLNSYSERLTKQPDCVPLAREKLQYEVCSR